MGFNDTPNIEKKPKGTIEMGRDRVLTKARIFERSVIDSCRTGDFSIAHEKLDAIREELNDLYQIWLRNHKTEKPS